MRPLNKTASDRFAAPGEPVLSFWTDEQAQDVTEYTLLLSFVVLISAALMILNGSSISGIWGDANTILGKGYLQASGS